MTGGDARPSFRARIAHARARTDALFALVAPGALRSRPIPERHRFVFYVGHLEAFDANLLRHAVDVPFSDPALDTLFAFGIDPVDGDLPSEPEEFWPATEAVIAYGRRVRGAIDAALARLVPGEDAGRDEVFETALEHRLMHAETLAYMLARLPLEALPPPPDAPEDAPPPERRAAGIPAGRATLGKARDAGFGWDNEHEEHAVAVEGFEIDVHPVTNGDYLAFVEAGGYGERSLWSEPSWRFVRSLGLEAPATWRRDGAAWRLRATFADIPLPASWPAWVSHAEAEAFARWSGGSLPTEAQWQRAAFGTPGPEERTFPWGEAPLSPRLANAGEARWDPLPVTAHPGGASAFGVEDLIGNGWEWTSSTFGPLPGFVASAVYPGYSEPFFDGKHYVLKGAGPRTAAPLVRRSFRNWFQPHYPHVQAKFRCVRGEDSGAL